ncbi:hypothetical protein R1flu_002940 [Riccia fluitans]|uniref:Reverse transcriptase zinc-binding domain-containing protein n=1 Tax=Riccia fluitans TaxID=41844 RepID=A0ABD1Y7Q3_9MARC
MVDEWKLYELRQERKNYNGRSHGPCSKVTWLLDNILSRRDSTTQLEDLGIWRWNKENLPQKCWSKSTIEWKKLMDESRMKMDQLNNRWGVSWQRERWKSLWTRLWQTKIFLRDKYWIWRVLHGGFFLNARTQKMGMGDGLCQRCNKDMESANHCFSTCEKNRERWQQINEKGQRLLPEPIPRGNFAEWIDGVLRMKEIRIPLLLIAISFSKTIWKERCSLQFENKRLCKPVIKIVQESGKLSREIEYVAADRGQKSDGGNASSYLKLIEEELEKDLVIYHYNRRRINGIGDDWSVQSETPCPTSSSANTENVQNVNENSLQCDNLDQLQKELENLGFM